MTYLHEPTSREPQATFHVPGITSTPDTDPIRNLSELTQPRKDGTNLRKIDRVAVDLLREKAANQFAIVRTLNTAIDNSEMPRTLQLGNQSQDIKGEAAVLVMALSKLDPDPENPQSGYFKTDNQFVIKGIGAVLKYSGVVDRKTWSTATGVQMPGQVVDNVVKKIETIPGWTEAMPGQKIATIDAAVASLIGMGNIRGALEFMTKVHQLIPDRPNAIGEAFNRAHTQGLFDYAIQIGGPKAEVILAAIAQKGMGGWLSKYSRSCSAF